MGRRGEARRRQRGPAVRREKVKLDGGDRAGKVLLARWLHMGGGVSSRQDAPAQLLCF